MGFCVCTELSNIRIDRNRKGTKMCIELKWLMTRSSVGRGAGGGGGGNEILGSVIEGKWLVMKEPVCLMETEIVRHYRAKCAVVCSVTRSSGVLHETHNKMDA